MRDVTLVYLIRDNVILLAKKKDGFGAGFWNGYGGKPQNGEHLENTAIRETQEESGVTIRKEDLRKVAEIELYFPLVQHTDWNQRVHVFFVNDWTGDPQETNETFQPERFSAHDLLDGNALIYDTLWPADRYWLPLVLAGKRVKGNASFGKGREVLEYEFREVATWA